MKYIFNKGELNKLYNLNQEVKNIFDEYYLLPNDFIVGESKLQKGQHFIISPFKMFGEYPSDIVFKMNSQNIYDAVSKNKKLIDSYTIKDKAYLYLTGTEEFMIGSVLTKLSIELQNKQSKVSEYVDIIHNYNTTNTNNSIILTSDEVQDLVKNEYINISLGKYRTRITKEVIPGLKKSHEIIIYCYDNNEMKDLFYLGIKVIRDGCISYHTYKCLYM